MVQGGSGAPYIRHWGTPHMGVSVISATKKKCQTKWSVQHGIGCGIALHAREHLSQAFVRDGVEEVCKKYGYFVDHKKMLLLIKS